MIRSAVFSACGQFRYLLVRRWASGPALLYVMLNPSTAGDVEDDATVRRCMRFAQSHDFGGLEIVNLYAYIATSPRDLRRAGYPVGPDNDQHICLAATRAAAVCIAWGASVGELERPQVVLPMLRRLVGEPQCLSITRSGYPQHPLYLASSCRLHPFTEDALQCAMEPA